MTALNLQLMHVPDCELAIERAYFNWGRGRVEDSPDPDWNDANLAQREVIAQRGYALYDGLSAQYGNTVAASEIFASVAISFRAVLNDAIRFLRRSAEAEPMLARIPDHAADHPRRGGGASRRVFVFTHLGVLFPVISHDH